MRRRRYSPDQWVEWLSEQPTSGLSITAFCQQKGVSANSFYLWRRKLAADITPSPPPNPFVPLSIVASSQVEIDLPCGATIRLPEDERTTRQVLAVLLEAGAAG